MLPRQLKRHLFEGAGLLIGVSILWTSIFYVPKPESPKIEVSTKPIIAEPTVDNHILTDDELSRLYSCRNDVINDSCLNLTIDEATLLMQIARSEGGDTYEGQLWVMGCIINRLNDGGFGDSIYEIVSAPGQFEVFTSGRYKKADVNENSHLALADIESGYNPTNGALYFESSSNSADSWHHNNREFIKEVEGQRYYR